MYNLRKSNRCLKLRNKELQYKEKVNAFGIFITSKAESAEHSLRSTNNVYILVLYVDESAEFCTP